MAVLANLARMTTATTGTGTLTLGSAVSGFLTFAAAGITNGQTVSYAIEDGANREVGRGVYSTSGTTLTRTVLKSTNSNAAISLSGNAQVFITALAEDLDKATAANIRAGAADKIVTADVIEAALAPVVSASVTGTIATDWSSHLSRDLTATGNLTFSNPTNVEPGTSREIWVFGNDSTERSISWGTNIKGAIPDETVTSTRGLHIVMSARTSSFISLSWKVIEL